MHIKPIFPHRTLIYILGTLFVISFFFFSCSKQEEKVIIAFSQCTSDDLWRQTMEREMKREIAFHENVELLILDAQGQSWRQVKQIELLLDKKIDLLIISPNESSPITPAAEMAYKRGVPTIIIDRKIDSENYTAYIGANNYEIGHSVGEYLGRVTQGKGRIFEISGLEGSSPARDRHRGFIDGISQHPNLKIIKTVDGKWGEKEAERQINNNLYLDFDVVFAHNDIMAKAAQQACPVSRRDSIYFIGIDALPQLGVNLVRQKLINASFMYPTGGDKAIQLALGILGGKNYAKENTLATAVVDSTNAHVLQLQYEQILSYQNDIERQMNRLAEQRLKYNDQQSLLYIFMISVGLLVLFAVALFYSYFVTNQQNQLLAEKNTAIEAQKAQLEAQNEEIRSMNKKVEAATQAKIRFFTNISHEIRTPITLIQAPLQNLLTQLKPHQLNWKKDLEMMWRNTDRLLRLVNQLMDFRKVELGKIELQAAQQDLVEFVKQIHGAFLPMAQKKNINFSFETETDVLLVWFDYDKLDKSIFNILSNAFKFTPTGGEISIRVHQKKEEALISISDTGVGIAPEKQEKIFQRFYQQSQHQHMGTGIGLALCSEFIQLHHGTVELISSEGHGSNFIVHLKLGTAHFSNDQLMGEHNVVHQVSLAPQPNESETQSVKTDATEKSNLLIVEDNEDLREYLRQILEAEYNIWEAENGLVALELIEKEHPDLILTDVMMPDMNGLELCKHLKSETSTSHLPLLMLTARASIVQKIEGIEMGADAYIEKPFNPDYLVVRLKKLLESRRSLREHFRSEFSLAKVESSPTNKPQKQFLQRVNEVVEREYQDSGFSVERLGGQVGLSRIQLYRKLKALTGLTPNEFINKFRLQKASFLLEKGELNITEVAYEVGFSSHAYFTKRFREQYQQTPSEYAKVGGR